MSKAQQVQKQNSFLKTINNKKVVFFVFISSFILIVFINIIYIRYGHIFLESMYNKSAIYPFNKIIIGQNSLTLEYYLSFVDSAVNGLNLFLTLYFLGFFVITYWVKEDFTKKFLLSLLWADFCFIIIHIWQGGLWRMNEEWSFPDIFQYSKEIFLGVILLLFYIKAKQKIFILYSGVFFYFFLDDSLGFHEKFSFFSMDTFYIGLFGKKIELYSEDVLFGIVGVIIIFLFFLTYRKSDFLSRKIALIILILLFIFAFFAAVIDYINNFFASKPSELPLIIEESGEMFVISIICFYILRNFISYDPKLKILSLTKKQ